MDILTDQTWQNINVSRRVDLKGFMEILKLQIKFDKTWTWSFPDDSISLPTGLQQDQDFTFSERAGCNNGETTIGCFF